MQVQVTKKRLKYGRRTYQIGEPVDVSRKDGRFLIAIGRARIPQPPRADIPASPSVPVTIVETVVEPEVQPEIVPERGYEREDMQAEVETSERTVRPKRRYQRRDMQAEE